MQAILFKEPETIYRAVRKSRIHDRRDYRDFRCVP